MAVRSGLILLAMVSMACSWHAAQARDGRTIVLSSTKQTLITNVETASGDWDTAGSVVSAATLADQILLCSASMLKGHSNQSAAVFDASWEQVVTFIESINDVCDLMSEILSHWDEGCGYLMDEIVAVDNYFVCSVSRECLSNQRTYTPLHASCYERCENSVGEDGVAVTECNESLFSQIGIDHPRVCGENIPLDVFFNYINPLELFVTIAYSFVLTITATGLGFVLPFYYRRLCIKREAWVDREWVPGDEDLSWPGAFEAVGMVYHGTVIIHMFLFLVTTLNGEHIGSACDFIIMNTCLFYGPFVFSFSQIVFCLASCCSLAASGASFPDAWTILMLFGCVPGFIIALVAASLMFMVSAAMIISTLWSFFAYGHITVLLIFLCALVPSMLYHIVRVLLECLKVNHSPPAATTYIKVLPFILFGYSAWSCLVLIHMNGFLLYFHGDYWLFHNGLLSDTALTLPSVPSFWFPSLEDLFDSFNVIFGKIESFDWDVQPGKIFEFSVGVQLLLTVCTFNSRIIYFAYKECKGKKNNNNAAEVTVPAVFSSSRRNSSDISRSQQ